jgi:hypothetical protein
MACLFFNRSTSIPSCPSSLLPTSFTLHLTIFVQGAVSGSIIEAVLCPNVPQLYYIRVNGDSSFSLLIPPIQPVFILKNSIASSIGVAPGQLHISANGRRLDLQHSLLNLGIESGAWLDCVVVPSTFGCSTFPRVNSGLAIPRALTHAMASQQLAMQRVFGEDSVQPSESRQLPTDRQTVVVID